MASPQVAEPGQLTAVGKDGRAGILCPLKGTVVNANVSGFGAEVKVVQTFANPSKTPIEAVYTFPLPADAAVNRMRIEVGTRVIEGVIKRRDEARRIYEAAKNAGQAAALLDQERPNIFTQSVANIMPGAQVRVEITYVQLIKYEHAQFEFSYPMVVGPRYLGNAPDPDKIAPPTLSPGVRSGATIDLNVHVDAGAPILGLQSVLHQVNVQKNGNRATVSLKKADEIPNKDFILRYSVATDAVQTSLITQLDKQKGGFFSLAVMPPKVPAASQIAPREIIFVMDQSGSQSGFPIEKSKELTIKMIKSLRPGDTFNVIGFNTVIKPLWVSPQGPSSENMAAASNFVNAMNADGGTNIREGVVAALEGQNDPSRLRIVLFNTDGLVGDEKLILDTIQKRRDKARMFTFGIGNGVNRFLIDAMSVEGRGAAEYVTLAESADGAVANFLARTQTPVLTDLTVEFEGVQVSEAFPQALPDVFAGQPIVINGRYAVPGKGRAILKGRLGGEPWTQTVPLDLGSGSQNPALPTLWARKKVDDLTRSNWLATISPENRVKNSVDGIVDVALEYRIMTEYTSFVAVEPRVINVGGKLRTVHVPVELTDGAFGVSVDGRPVLLAGNVPGSFGRGSGAGGGSGGLAGKNQIQAGQGLNYVTGNMSTKGKSSGGTGGGAGQHIDYISYDPADTRPLTDPKDIQARYEHKVSKSLREAKGPVEVMVWLWKVDAKLMETLKAKGLKVAAKDDKMMIVFGSCDVKALKELAALPEVEFIRPIE